MWFQQVRARWEERVYRRLEGTDRVGATERAADMNGWPEKAVIWQR